MNYKLIKIFFFLLLFSGCGFKLVKDNFNYQITDIISSGDKRINYILKNNLLKNSNKKNNKIIQLKINTKKEKTIKEKNISNQVTKYEIKIETLVEYTDLENIFNNKFTISKNGFYDVASRHSETLNNEKDLVKLLVKSLSDDIINNLKSDFND